MKFNDFLRNEINKISSTGSFKKERIILSPQNSIIKTKDSDEVINFCANNYLGLSSDPDLIHISKKYLDSHGYGLSSVRFICGTQDIHKELEKKISNFLYMEDAILYASAFDANAGLFETLLSVEDAIISDELNHASIIDGIRLCKAKRYRYLHGDMQDLEKKLIDSKSSRFRLIATDGVFSMDGDIAKLDKICKLAKKYDALVMVDDCHSTGLIGEKGRGTHEFCNVVGKVDIITGTFGKALGGAIGGFTCAKKEIIEILRQKSRPYLFSNSLPPSVVAPVVKVISDLESSTILKDKLFKNTIMFREGMKSAGFKISEGIHPIVPIMLNDSNLSQIFAKKLLDLGIYVIGFCYPVVPRDKARIRVQISASHSKEQILIAVNRFKKVAKELKFLK